MTVLLYISFKKKKKEEEKNIPMKDKCCSCKMNYSPKNCKSITN